MGQQPKATWEIRIPVLARGRYRMAWVGYLKLNGRFNSVFHLFIESLINNVTSRRSTTAGKLAKSCRRLLAAGY
jgi:hypothetical protein